MDKKAFTEVPSVDHRLKVICHTLVRTFRWEPKLKTCICPCYCDEIGFIKHDK